MPEEQGERREDWIEELRRKYQDHITRGLLEGVFALDDQAAEVAMTAMGHACAQAFVQLHDLKLNQDLDTFLQKICLLGPGGKIKISRNGDTILWEEAQKGECVCPLVRRGVIEPHPRLCLCGVKWVQFLVEKVAQRPATVELVEAVALGHQNCTYRVTLG